MKKLFLLVLAISIYTSAYPKPHAAVPKNPYQFTIDLTKVQHDRLPVTLKTPRIKASEIIYNLPKIVPGTYAVYNFGKFISDFKAYDKKGRPLAVQQLDQNRWKISKASKLDHITYWVDDTFDVSKKEDLVFEPGGTNIEADKNFLLNTHGFIGYFDNLKSHPYELTITKPTAFYGSTPLKAVKTSSTTDTYRIASYMEVVDSPLMYNVPDTTNVTIGGAQVLVSVYDAQQKIKARDIATNIRETLEAQKTYLGGKLPVDKYAFLIYIDDAFNTTGSFGALEHSYSSVYYLPPLSLLQIAGQIRNIAAHEFFHIVTPLHIHSEEIGNFDFQNPKMSQHLWLYEGVTEYFASHVQVNQKLIAPEAYLTKLSSYIANSKQYNDTLPFTRLSKGALDVYENQYGNVYQKGALLALALDIRLRELSGGKYGIRNLMTDLAKTYGKERSFKDEELFATITALTYPEIGDFFQRYVAGTEPLPYAAIFNTVGLQYVAELTENKNTFGSVNIQPNKEGRIVIVGTEKINSFGKKMGYRKGDVILALNGQNATAQNLNQLVSQHILNVPVGTTLRVTVARPGSNGKLTNKILSGKVMPVPVTTYHVLRSALQTTEKQKQLFAAWLFSSL